MLGCVDLFQLYGSVVPRSLIAAVYGGALGFSIKWGSDHYDEFAWAKHYTHGGVWYHPYSLHVLGMVLGFSLVMRIQSTSRHVHSLPATSLTVFLLLSTVAYARFWEGATQTHLASSKWGDAVMQVFAFDEVRVQQPLSQTPPMSSFVEECCACHRSPRLRERLGT